MGSSNLKMLLTEYEKKRMNAIFEAEKRKFDLYKKEPKLEEIDNKLSKEAINISKQIITSKNPSLISELNSKLSLLKEEKKKLLNSLNIDDNYLKPHYECSDCNDTGYITNSHESVMCHCLRQKLFDLEYNKSNISNLEKDNFDNFSFELYSKSNNFCFKQ